MDLGPGPSLLGHLGLAAHHVGCQPEVLLDYLVRRVDRHIPETRVTVPVSFNSIRVEALMKTGITHRAAVKAVADARIDPEGLPPLGDVIAEQGAPGLITGLEINARGERAAIVKLDAEWSGEEALAALDTLGVSPYALRVVGDVLDAIPYGAGTSVEVRLPERGSPDFRMLKRVKFDAPGHNSGVARGIGEAMRRLKLSDQHSKYIISTLDMFRPGESEYEIVVGLPLEYGRVRPQLHVEYVSLPTTFVMEVLIAYGQDADVARRLGRLQGLLGMADEDGIYWVDGFTLMFQGSGPPATTLRHDVFAEDLSQRNNGQGMIDGSLAAFAAAQKMLAAR